MGFNIREARLDDVNGIANLHVKTWQYAYKGIVDQEYLNNLSIEKRKKSWNNKLKEKSPRVSILVAVSDEKILGFSAVGPSRDKDATNNIGEIYSIYIDHFSLRKGIGTALIQRGLKELKSDEFKNVTVWVLEKNTIGRNFYKKCGFVFDGTSKKEEMDGQLFEEVRYMKELGLIRSLS